MPDIPSKRRSIWVQIKLEGSGFASDPEFDLRYALSDAVDKRGIGITEGSGSGGGWMDISFGVDDLQGVQSALVAVSELLSEYKVPDDQYRLEVFRQFDLVCDGLPDFQPGDGLYYRFGDGDYGAVVVLKSGNADTLGKSQVGKPPPSDDDEMLVGVLNYKHPERPTSAVFEQRNWLLSTGEERLGQPYLIWVSCFGGIEIELVSRRPLNPDDPRECNFHLSWEDLPEYFIREKYRSDPALNPYESILENFPKFEPGTGLSYRFPDGSFGAALVLATSEEGPNIFETLLGVIDYKVHILPSISVFEQRNWLTTTQPWRKGLPFLVWALWWPENIEIIPIGHLELVESDPKVSQLNLNWEDIPEFVQLEKNWSESE